VIQCGDCEFFGRGSEGQMSFRCDPFANIKESDCLAKWQILRTVELLQKVERMVAAYEATLAVYKRLEPLQEKMFRRMEKEIEQMEEGDSWKGDEDANDAADGDDDDDDDRGTNDEGGAGSPWSRPGR
jgi:hypothetical protein